jgi:hypothetical protein
MTIIALDCMGGDHGPVEAVWGAAELSLAREDIRLILVGDAPEVAAILDECSYNPSQLSIQHAPDWVEQREKPSAALKAKPEASILVACREVAAGRADAVVTGGSTGAAKWLPPISGELALRLLSDLYARAREQPWIGIVGRALTGDERARRGLLAPSAFLVTEVVGPASRAGLRASDVIVGLDGAPGRVGERLSELVDRGKPGDFAWLSVRRVTKLKTIYLEIELMPLEEIERRAIER